MKYFSCFLVSVCCPWGKCLVFLCNPDKIVWFWTNKHLQTKQKVYTSKVQRRVQSNIKQMKKESIKRTLHCVLCSLALAGSSSYKIFRIYLMVVNNAGWNQSISDSSHFGCYAISVLPEAAIAEAMQWYMGVLHSHI